MPLWVTSGSSWEKVKDMCFNIMPLNGWENWGVNRPLPSVIRWCLLLEGMIFPVFPTYHMEGKFWLLEKILRKKKKQGEIKLMHWERKAAGSGQGAISICYRIIKKFYDMLYLMNIGLSIYVHSIYYSIYCIVYTPKLPMSSQRKWNRFTL